MTKKNGLRLAIDIGGTFTDSVLMNATGQILATSKTPTVRNTPALGALEGTELVLQEAGVDWTSVTGMIHGTTLATNALIERRGARVVTITTAGFRDILEIGYERRHSQYDINLVKPNLLVPRSHALTIEGRMDAHGNERTPLKISDIDRLVDQLKTLNAEAVAICLLHAYANPAHEVELAHLLNSKMPQLVLSLSSEVSPEAREFDRLCTTIANAYIQPLMASYLSDFDVRFRRAGLICPILMMTAGGGMTTVETAARLPVRLVESGPAGGAILAARIAAETGEASVLSFDMGGTTAKLCLIDEYRPQTARKFEISRAERFVKGSGMPVRIPVIEMIEIGAGGGSIARIDRLGRLLVGPQSAGSDPGPVAFGKGGTQPTVTDGDVVLGLIDPERFAEGRLKIDEAAAARAMSVEIGEPLAVNADGASFSVSEIVDESMASAGRMHAVESGKDISARLMIAFGGNGPLHATRVARRAQITRILIPRDPGVGSAVGFLFAPVSFEIIRTFYTTLGDIEVCTLNAVFDDMLREAETVVRAGAPEGKLEQRRVAFMRYQGQGHEIEIELPARPLIPTDIAELHAVFEKEYARQFSRTVPGMEIEILNWGISVASPATSVATSPKAVSRNVCLPSETREIFCDVTGEWRTAGVFERSGLSPGDVIQGPALIIESQTTTFVSADFLAAIDTHGNIWMTHEKEQNQ